MILRDMKAVGATCLMAAIVLIGCSKHNLPGDVGTVSGRATYKGQPLPAGSIVNFVHLERGIVGFGLTDSDGNFKIRMRDRPEVLVGEYDVSVLPPQDVDIARAIDSGMPLTEKQQEFANREWKEIPKHYRSINTSRERFTVNPGHNEYLLDLKDEPPPRKTGP